jgi:hypothetical protein
VHGEVPPELIAALTLPREMRHGPFFSFGGAHLQIEDEQHGFG